MGFFSSLAEGVLTAGAGIAAKNADAERQIMIDKARAISSANAETQVYEAKAKIEAEARANAAAAAKAKYTKDTSTQASSTTEALGSELNAMRVDSAAPTVVPENIPDVKIGGGLGSTQSIIDNVNDTPTLDLGTTDTQDEIKFDLNDPIHELATAAALEGGNPDAVYATEAMKRQNAATKKLEAVAAATARAKLDVSGAIEIEKEKNKLKGTLKPSFQVKADETAAKYGLPSVNLEAEYGSETDRADSKKARLKVFNSDKAQEMDRSLAMVAADAEKAANAIIAQPDNLGLTWKQALPDFVRNATDSNFAIVKDSQGKLTLSYKNIGGGLAGAISNYEGQKLDKLVIDTTRDPETQVALLRSISSAVQRMKYKKEFAVSLIESNIPERHAIKMINEYDSNVPIYMTNPKTGNPVATPSIEEWVAKGKPDLRAFDGFTKLAETNSATPAQTEDNTQVWGRDADGNLVRQK